LSRGVDGPPSTPKLAAAARARYYLLAEDLGRLRRLLSDDPTASYATLLAERLADHILALDAILEPSASELCLVAGFHDDGVQVALEAGDRRIRELHLVLACPGCLECR
jgi:hypothetical protein